MKKDDGFTGHHHSDEAKVRISMSLIGNKHTLGHHPSVETRAKQSVAHMGNKAGLGHHPSPETRAKLSAAHLGRPFSEEHKRHIADAEWRGGSRATKARRRLLRFVPLNEPFAGCEGHHVDDELVIYMPKKLHHSVFHSQSTGQGMAQINAIAYNFLFKQEVEVALATSKEQNDEMGE